MSRPVDESMNLLKSIMGRPLDAGYREAAERRAAGGEAGSKASWVVVVALALRLKRLNEATP